MTSRLLSRCILATGALFLAWAFAPQAGAAAPLAQEPQLQITSIVTDGWPSVEATVTVVDAAGGPVTGLTAADFAASVDGQPLPITGITTASDPSIGIAVLMVFDLSGSMAGEPLAQAMVAGKALLAQLGPTDQAAVLAFADQPTLVQGFTGDQAALGQAIDSLVAVGNTALYAAIEQSAALAGQAPLPRRAVVVLSDGVDFGAAAGTTREAALAAAEQSGAAFMTIGLGPAIDSEFLSQLAALGRGQFLVAPGAGDLEALYTTVGGILRQQYVLSLDASALDSGFASGTLRIEALAGGVTIAAETELTAPAGAQPTPPPDTPTAASTTAVATATATPAPPAAEEEEGGGSAGALLAVALGGLAVVSALALGAVLLIRRRGRPRESEADATHLQRLRQRSGPVDFPAIARAAPAPEEAGAWLELPGGERFALTGEPITIGFTGDCTVRLPGAGDRLERARIWLRDGRYMLHNLSRVGGITVGGRAVSWVVLEDGDTLAFGSEVVIFREAAGGGLAEI